MLVGKMPLVSMSGGVLLKYLSGELLLGVKYCLMECRSGCDGYS